MILRLLSGTPPPSYSRSDVITHLSARNIRISRFIHDEWTLSIPDDFTVKDVVVLKAELEVLFVP